MYISLEGTWKVSVVPTKCMLIEVNSSICTIIVSNSSNWFVSDNLVIQLINFIIRGKTNPRSEFEKILRLKETQFQFN